MQRRGQPLGWALSRPLGGQARSRQHGQNRARTPALRPPQRSLRFSVCLYGPACASPFVRQVGGDPSKGVAPGRSEISQVASNLWDLWGLRLHSEVAEKNLLISRKGLQRVG